MINEKQTFPQTGSHIHGKNCGHTNIKHNNHEGHLVEGKLHCTIPESENPNQKIFVEHYLENEKSNNSCAVKNECHEHNENCGHEAVLHGDHTDYLVNGYLHHRHNGHCDKSDAVRLLKNKSDFFVSVSIEKEGVKRRHHLRNRKQKKKPIYKEKDYMKFIVMLAIVGSYFFVEIIYGLWIKSIALVGDALHMLTDFIALCIGFYSVVVSRSESTDEATFGWARMEIVGGLINACFLLAIAFNILIESITKLIDQSVEQKLIENALQLIIVAVVGLVINIIGIFMFSNSHLHSHSHGESEGHHEKNENLNMKAVFLHVLGDSLNSVAVIATGLIIYFSTWEKRFLVDPICSLIISIIIFITSFPVFKKAISVLLEKTPSKINTKTLKSSLLKVEGVHDVHDLHIWQLTMSKIIGSCHVVLEKKFDVVHCIDELKRIFHSEGVHSTAIQQEFHADILQRRGQLSAPAERCFDRLCEAENCVENACCKPFEHSKNLENSKFLEKSKNSANFV